MMSQYEEFLSPTRNVGQRVLTQHTRQGLIDRQVIQNRPEATGFDIIKLLEIAAIPITFPDCRFHQIPYRLVGRAFIEYLGIDQEFSAKILLNSMEKNNSTVNGETIYKYIKGHVQKSLDVDGEIWQDSFEQGVLPAEIPINVLINWLGFDGTFIADFMRLKITSFRDPDIMDYYLVEEQSNKAVPDFNLVDYIFATLLRRLENLRSFENAAKVYLNQNPLIIILD